MEIHMDQALKMAQKGITPFGAVVVYHGEVLASAYNTVKQTMDPTAHAEVNAIREACRKVEADKLPGAELFTTCEPCPMCAAAAFFAGISHIYYGADIPTIARYLPQIHLRATEVVGKADRAMKVIQLGEVDDFVKLLKKYG